MFEGFNGEIVTERFDTMTDNGNRLFITEFDTIQMDIHERALDLEDFIRLAYSYPYTDGIILWNFMRTKNSGEGQGSVDTRFDSVKAM